MLGPELLLAVASPVAGRQLQQLWDVGSEAWLLGLEHRLSSCSEAGEIFRD